MRQLHLLLFCHLGCLILAATNFAPIHWFMGDWIWGWNYFEVRFHGGWGAPYEHVYTLAQVSFYVVAYGVGTVAFVKAWRRFSLQLARLAAILCVVGVISFGIELTHWFWEHQSSWILSFPGVMVVLWALVTIQVLQRTPVKTPRTTVS